MRETFKSLSIFSAMLMLLLMLSTGCNLSIPGCGKRTSTALNNNIAPVPATVPVAVANSNSSAPAVLKSTAPVVSQTKPLAASTTAPTPVPVDVEKIAYTTLENGKPTLWTMDPNGTNRSRLTTIGSNSWHPLWSPNGKTLAFLSDVNDGKVNLYIAQKGSTILTELTSWEDMPTPDTSFLAPTFTWSPKSDQIAYAYKNQIWVIQLDSLEQTTLVTVDPAYSISSVQWAPHRENKFIAYTVRKGLNYYSVMLSNPRLKDHLTLVNSTKAIPAISWSPDAVNVAYVAGAKALYLTSIEDTSPKLILSTAGPQFGNLLAFTPSDSSTKLFVLSKKSQAESGYRLAVLDQLPKNDKDIPTLKFLTEPGVDSATWSPDGNKIAYVTNGELWITDVVNGNSKTRVALTGIQSPDWSRK